VGFFKLLEATVKAATLPVTVVADVVTLGGQLTDRTESYTGKTVREIAEDIDEIGD